MLNYFSNIKINSETYVIFKDKNLILFLYIYYYKEFKQFYNLYLSYIKICFKYI